MRTRPESLIEVLKGLFTGDLQAIFLKYATLRTSIVTFFRGLQGSFYNVFSLIGGGDNVASS